MECFCVIFVHLFVSKASVSAQALCVAASFLNFSDDDENVRENSVATTDSLVSYKYSNLNLIQRAELKCATKLNQLP